VLGLVAGFFILVFMMALYPDGAPWVKREPVVIRAVGWNFTYLNSKVAGANYAADDGRLSNLTHEDGRLETSTYGLYAEKNGMVTDGGKPVGRCDLASRLPRTCRGWVVIVRNNLEYIEDANGKFWRVAANGLIADDETHKAAGACNPDEIVMPSLLGAASSGRQ
jgi:hypothetical protein